MKTPPRGLGRGLSALFSDTEEAYGHAAKFSQESPASPLPEDIKDLTEVDIDLVRPNPNQPRKHFDEAALNELADSIKKHGLIMPIVVNRMEDGKYMIIAGERRYRASRIAGKTKIPVVVREYDDRQIKEISLIENLQREDLNPIEAANAMKQLMDEYHLTQEELAERIGKSRPAVTNTLRLLSLSPEVISLVSAGKLSAGHARALITLPEDVQYKLAEDAIKDGLSVRDIERSVREYFATPDELAEKKEKKKQAGGLLLSAALTCMLTGITEPLEFSFLFVAPLLFVVQVILAGAAYMIAHILNIAVGLTFSGGFIDLFIFGILQGNDKTNWMRIIPVGIIYFILYYVIFRFLIQKFNLKTPGREDDDAETKLYTKADYKAKQGAKDQNGSVSGGDERSILITQGLGGKKNISDVDCCATRLRCTVVKPELVNDQILKQTGPSGIVKKGQGIQIIYGPSVTVVKSNLEDYLVNAPDEEYIAQETAPEPEEEKKEETKNTVEKTTKKVLCSPFTGEAHPITDTPDEAFAGKMMGDGYMVMPEEGVVYAPEDSTVSFVFPTNHAIGLTTEDGVEYLLHIGVDTVKLEGKGFEMFVNNGDFVKKGDKLMAFDIQYIKEHAKSEACIAVFTGLTEEEEIVMKASGHVNAQEDIAEIVSC